WADPPPCRVPRFHLIDLHAVRIGRPLSWQESRSNLVLYNRWFQLRASRADRLRFWLSYSRSRQTLTLATADRAREVERATVASNLRFWARRQSRCLGNNRYFRRVKTARVRGFAVRDLPDAVVKELLANPDAVFARPDVTILKDSRTSTVAALTIATPEGPRAVVFKRVNVRRWFEPLKNLFRSSPVLRSWVNGHTLRDRWLPTSRPLLALHRYCRGLPAEGYLLTELVPDAVGLPDAVSGPRFPAFPTQDHTSDSRHSVLRTQDSVFIPRAAFPSLREKLEKLARTVRTMHDRGVSHRDLKAPNVLLQGAEPVLIDLVGVQVGRPVPFRQRARELARLNASFLRSPLVTRVLRLRFLWAYLAAGPGLGIDWKTWWRTIGRATAAKVMKNRKSGRPLS